MLMGLIGLVFCAGSAVIAKNSLDAKNMIETAMFGFLGLSTGVFLIMSAFTGAPVGKEPSYFAKDQDHYDQEASWLPQNRTR
jgi:hypothetical protein